MKPRIYTYTKKEVNPLDLRPEDIDIRDIAHALALTNRFAGHTRWPISVGLHSIFVAKLVRPYGQALAGLLHDATEAYLGDMTKWVKAMMPDYKAAEHRASLVIAEAFGLSPYAFETPEIAWADRVMVRFEGQHKFGCGERFVIEHPDYPPLTEDEILVVGTWTPLSWSATEELFLRVFDELRTDVALTAPVISLDTKYW